MTGFDPTQLPIATERLILEPLSKEHAAELFDALQDSRIYEWISSAPPTSVTQLGDRWADVNRPTVGTTTSLGWAVRHAASGVYIGKCDAEISPNHVATNVGYIVSPQFWNQGYASEALGGIVSVLARLGVTELHAYVTVGNVASERVLARAGFVRRGLIPNNDVIRGRMCDDVHYVRAAE